MSTTRVSPLSLSLGATHKLPRIHVSQSLAVGEDVVMDADVTHYITNVMRVRAGAPLRLFNCRDGEWLGVLAIPPKETSPVSNKRARRNSTPPVVINIMQQLRNPADGSNVPSVHLFFAPIKKQRVKLLFEKATELGVHRLIPVLTQNTNEKWNSAGDTSEAGVPGDDSGSLGRILVESAEQCERLSIPVIDAPTTLNAMLSRFQNEHPHSRLLVCKERSNLLPPKPKPILVALQDFCTSSSSQLCLLVGPEGGFTDAEFADMASREFVQFVSLGESILRAETAALKALSVAFALFESSSQ